MLFRQGIILLVLVTVLEPVFSQSSGGYSGKCVDDRGNPRKCVPEFENAAFEMPVEVTSTCGEQGPVEYCIQTGSLGLKRACDICDARDPRLRHPASALTDLTTNDNETWWQSETMYEGIQWPNRVNLTLRLRKSFDITYVRLKFHSPRPESFAIYKRVTEDGPWIPYQYYSATCRDFYGLPDQAYVYGGDETRALCTSEFSDISPLTGGNVAFSTLEGRPSAFHNFENSKELSEWVTATDIRVTLDRLNTFGDEVFGDEKVHRSYFYGISDLAVGGVCKCNGHASRCESQPVYGERGETNYVTSCVCEHNTAGRDCEQCLPFYNDVPWGRATSTNVHECKACNCNGFSNRCFFDVKLYEASGHGGHCLDCAGNRDGANCERCKPNFYQRSDGYCIPCYCNEVGSRSLQCNSEGQCQCQPGVTGEKCDRCQANYYEFSVRGCKECSCSVAGSLGNEPSCTTDTGFCSCKENVEGQQCDKCKPGYFNIDVVNEFGCTPCFCYGHSAVCQSAPGYGQVILESIFSRSNERWTAEEQLGRQIPIQFNAVTENIGVTAAARESIYFLAPDRFLGDQRGSYNQELNFTLRIGEHGPKPSAEDIIIEGAGLRISRPIFGYRNTLPSIQNQDFTFRLHEHVEFGWNPRLSSRDFISILSNLTAIKIRATYTPKGVGFLDNVKLKTARRGAAGAPAPWIESCTCPDGYIGQYCESCAPGYTHEPKNGGPFARCVPCSCNGHASICDPESGQCICEHQTAGDNCERCARGYYGNSLKGTENDCNVCPCPLIGTSVGACIQLQDETTIVCLECPTGYAGPQCEFCGDGYFGDPTGQFGPRRDCQACDCNDNIDPNAVGNCNRTTGECIKCIYNTGGAKCDKCLPGFFGDALALPKGDCKNCECNGLGTIPTAEGKLICEEPTGKCPCKDNVIGRQCNACQDGYYDLASGTGCQLCMCDEVGSINVSCDVRSGHCNCREGVVGQRCNACAPNHYGFSLDGCKPCECDHIGSLGLQCDPQGQCPCRENVEGRACDRCKENKHNRQAGCVDCPACYNLIQDAATAQREKLDEMEKILDSIEKTQIVSNDQDFEVKLEQVQERVDRLWNNARSATGADESGFLDKVNELRDRVKALDQTSKQIGEALQQCSGNAAESTGNLTIAQDTVDRAQEALKNAQRFLDSDGKDALAKAQEKSNEYGQQSNMMSEMARQARALAEAHEKESAEIEKLGNAALNTSTTALDLLRGSMGQHSTITHEAKLLAQSTQQLEEEVKATKAKAQDALAKSKQAQDNALLLFKDAYAYNLPIVDLQTIKEQAQIAKTEAEKFKTDIEKLLEEKEGLLRESNEEVIQTKAMLENAIKHQQMADELMADLHSANSSAEEARKQSQDTFAEAQKIYDTLQDFNQKVESSKQAALEAKERIPEIQTLIAESESQTRQNQQALIGAKSAASYALKDAEKAKETAEKASKEATEIREECRVTKDQAGALRDEVEGLSRRVSDTLVRVAESEFLVGDDDTQVKTALEKASEAQSSSKSAYEKVQSALNTVRDIQLALDNLDAINEEGLEGLERKITQVESEFNSAGLDEKIAALREARNKQALWIKNYEDELEALRREVENVQEIRNSLPPDNKCWKRMRLEPV